MAWDITLREWLIKDAYPGFERSAETGVFSNQVKFLDAVYMSDSLDIVGDLTITGDLTVSGDFTFGDSIAVDGDDNMSALMTLTNVDGAAAVENGSVLADISGTANDGYIKVVVEGEDKYIPLYDLKAS
jgi:hypothetical protein